MKHRISKNKFIIEQLEPRLLFSADLHPIPSEVGLPYEDSATDFGVLRTDLIPNAVESENTPGQENHRHEVIFVDAGVPDERLLVDDLLANVDNSRHFEVVILDSNRDGIDQIGETLTKYRDIDAVHVVSHGSDGAVQLGNAWLTLDTIDAYAGVIEGWASSLNSQADILFYGCDLAAGDEGRTLINSLTFLTGADVAASDDPTGSEQLGGDWELEYASGSIESDVAISFEARKNWSAILASTFVGDGTAPPDISVGKNSTDRTVSAFSLGTNSGTDTLTDLTVTFSGSDVNDVAPNGVKIYEDNGTTANEWDESDTLIATATFAGNTANFTGLSININTTPTQYLVTYDIASGAAVGNTLQGAVTSATVTTNNPPQINDTVDATLTVVENLLLHPSGSAAGDEMQSYTSGNDATSLDTNDGDGSFGRLDNSSSDEARLELDDTAQTGTIVSVQIKAVMTDDLSLGTDQTRIGLRTYGVEYWSPVINDVSDGSYALYAGTTYTTNPNTGSGWTWAEINNLVAMVDNYNGDAQYHVTELYADVVYSTTTNQAPTDVSISASDIDENIDTSGGSSIGTLTSTDPDTGDTFTYSVVGGADQGNFSIGGAGSDELILTAGILNYEAKSSYEVIVRTTDSGGLTFDKTITVTVNDLNETPTAISLDNSTVAENAAGAIIGNLTTTDPDAGDTHTYTVDDVRFEVVAGQLKLKAGQSLDFETEPSVNVTVIFGQQHRR
jgi:hypothetical protein